MRTLRVEHLERRELLAAFSPFVTYGDSAPGFAWGRT